MSRPISIALAFCMLAALCSCKPEPTNKKYLGPEATIEGVWRSDANRENRLFLGADRWCLFELEPERLVIDGRFIIDETASNVRTFVVSLADTTTQYSWQQPLVTNFDLMKLHINVEGRKLTISSEEQTTCKLIGSYSYAGDDSPVKGISTVREWGEYLRNKGMNPSPQ